MKSIVPYTKEIQFNSKLAEICSISLEPELNIGDVGVEGTFIISGEYKAHEVSVNKENFTYKLPFSVDVTDNIIKDTIEFEVTDFTYEIIGEDTLKVDIEFSVTAEEEPIVIEPVVEEIEEREEKIDREAMIEEIHDMFSEIEEKEKEEKEERDEVYAEEIDNEEIHVESEEGRLDQESADLILNTANDKEDEYTTYYIHLVKPGDTIESIAATYQADFELLKQYNVMESINVGDKILIPSVDE